MLVFFWTPRPGLDAGEAGNPGIAANGHRQEKPQQNPDLKQKDLKKEALPEKTFRQ